MLSDHLRQSESLAAPCFHEPPVLLHRTPPAGETCCSLQVIAHCNSDHPMLNVCLRFQGPSHTKSALQTSPNRFCSGGALLLSAGGQLSAPLAAFSDTELDKKIVKVQYLSAIAKNSQKQAFKVRAAYACTLPHCCAGISLSC